MRRLVGRWAGALSLVRRGLAHRAVRRRSRSRRLARPDDAAGGRLRRADRGQRLEAATARVAGGKPQRPALAGQRQRATWAVAGRPPALALAAPSSVTAMARPAEQVNAAAGGAPAAALGWRSVSDQYRRVASSARPCSYAASRDASSTVS